MKQEFIKYAQELDRVGDLIIEISNTIPQHDNLTKLSKVEVIKQKEQLKVANDKYSSAVWKLRKMKVPAVVKTQHESLIEGVSSFVHGTSLMNDSIGDNGNIINDKQLLQGDAIHRIGVGLTKTSTKEIGDILVLNQ